MCDSVTKKNKEIVKILTNKNIICNIDLISTSWTPLFSIFFSVYSPISTRFRSDVHNVVLLQVQHRVSHVSNEEDDMQNDHTNNVPQSVETRTPNDRQTPTDTRPSVMDMRTTAMGTGTRTEAIKMLDQKPAKRKCYVWKICENKALLVDLISRLFFPFSFGVFNVFYWGTYTFDVDSMTET